MTEITPAKIDDYYNRWKNFLQNNNAEQHDFMLLARNDMLIDSFYKDLKENWNQDHAQKFANAFENTIIPKFNI